MAIETFRIFISATPEQIFPFVGDLHRHNEWTTDRIEFEPLTTGAICAGSQYRSTAKFKGTIIRAELKVKDYLPPERFAFTVEDRTGQYEHIFILKRQEGGTLIVREIHSVDTLLSRIIHPILLPILIKPEATKALQNLKDKVEHECQNRSNDLSE